MDPQGRLSRRPGGCSVFRPHNLVQRRHRLFAGHGQVVRSRVSPANPQAIQGSTTDFKDVTRLIAKVVSYVFVLLSAGKRDCVDSVDETRIIAVDKPRSNGPECRSTISCCHSCRAIFLLCFLPGPCCGNTQGQCFHCIFIALQPLRAVRWTEPPGFTRRIDCSISSMRPGYALSVSTWSTYTPLRRSANDPSPRCHPSKCAYACSSRRSRSPHRGQSRDGSYGARGNPSL